MKRVDTKQTTVRLPPVALAKLAAMAKFERRPLNSQFIVVVEDAIAEFERKHGPIVVENDISNN